MFWRQTNAIVGTDDKMAERHKSGAGCVSSFAPEVSLSTQAPLSGRKPSESLPPITLNM